MRFPEYEARYPWLSLLLDGLAVFDKGAAVAVQRARRKRNRPVACREGCGNCCRANTGLVLAGELNIELDPDLCRYITHPSVTKALNVIQEHRKICAEIAHPSDFREYLWGLLFDLVYLVTHILQDKSQRERALLLGGILCERLKVGEQVVRRRAAAGRLVSRPGL